MAHEARVLVVTGAGISAESGIPTFRGTDGYWRRLDPRMLATAEAFARDPALVWEWYRERRALVRSCAPNPAHTSVVKLARHAGHFLLLTQNVDDLHQRAEWEGHRLPAHQIVSIHGDLFVTRCSRCDVSRRAGAEDEAGVPVCPACGGLMRPGVIWFDEELVPDDVERVDRFLAGGPCDPVLVVGTTAAFDYIVSWVARAAGPTGRILEVNPEPSEISGLAAVRIRERAARAVPDIVDELIST
jgi:NAD-dependent deacetylase